MTRSLLALTLCATAACNADDPTILGPDQSLKITGRYATDFGSTVVIGQQSYTETGADYSIEQDIVSFDNDEQSYIAQSDMGFDKVLWVEKDGKLYLCTALFNQETEKDAQGEDEADPEDLEMGCGGFAWTVLTESEGGGEPDAGR